MLITVTADDISTLQGHGSVGTLTGTDGKGRRVTFAGEPRMLDAVASALLFEEEYEALVEVEGWQILFVEDAS